MKNFYSNTFLICTFLVILTSTVSCSKDDSNEDSKVGNQTVSEEILQLVNTHRAEIGKPKLINNALATKLANDHTLYMIEQGKLSHDNSGDRAQKLFNEEKAKSVAENVANKYKSAQEVVDVWLASDAHKKNIEANFTHSGISAIKDAAGVYYFTQIFLTK